MVIGNDKRITLIINNVGPAKMKSQEVHYLFLIFVLLSPVLVTIAGASTHPHLSLSVSSAITGVEGTKLQVNCTALGIAERIVSLKWFALRKTPTPTFKQHYRDELQVSLTISSLNRSDAGVYSCLLVTNDGMEETAEFQLFVRRRDRGGSTCKITQFKCKITKHCIFTRYRCDGKDDCGDGSDEDCPGDPCANKFRCNNRRCVAKHELCDHVDNCGDSSDEQAFCYEKKFPSTESPKDNGSSLPKTTIFMAIAIVIIVVIVICFIVILGCRAKMKRQQREARLTSAMNSARRLQERSETPRSPSQVEENSGEGQPFLLNAYQPYRNSPNIIVNVNNGVQYMPQYECPIRKPFMEAPPPYSEVRNANESSESAPPPYSTLSQDLAPESQRTNCDGTSSSQGANVDGNIELERLLTHAIGGVPHDGSIHYGDQNDISAVSGLPEDSNPSPNVHFGADDLGRLISQASNAYSQGADPDTSGPSSSRQTHPESRDSIHEASTMQSRPRSCVSQSSDIQFVQTDALLADRDGASIDTCHQPSLPDSDTNVAPVLDAENVNLPSSSGANAQSSSLPTPITHKSLPLSSRHDRSRDSINPSPSRMSNTSLSSPSRSGSSRNSDSVNRPVLSSQHSSPAHPAFQQNSDDASSALLQEVSRRDERNKPQPGHLSVQGGQIVLHTDSGVLAGQTIVPTAGGVGRPAQSPGKSAAASQLGGEIVVKDGVIMLQIPVSQLILNKAGATHTAPESLARAEEAPTPEGHATGPVSNLSPSPSLPPPAESASNSDSPSAGKLSPSATGGGRHYGELNIRDGQIVLEPPQHTPSSQILSHLQGAYSQEENDPLLGEADDRLMEPVVNTKRVPGVTSGGRHFASKCNSDVVLPPQAKDHQNTL